MLSSGENGYSIQAETSSQSAGYGSKWLIWLLCWELLMMCAISTLCEYNYFEI